MLQAHSLLWNSLWVAPNALLFTLGLVLWRRGFSHRFPAFVAFALISATGDLVVFAADLVPFVSAVNFWRIDWICLVVESFLKFLVIGEVLSRLLSPYPSVARLGKFFVAGFGATLVLVAAVAAAFASGDSSVWLISGVHLVEQTVFIVQLGLIVSVLIFAAYFRMSWDRLAFGIVLGLGISACGHLVTWALIANANPSSQGRTLLAFFNMAIYNLCVLIWGYYLLVPGKVSTKVTSPALPDHNLDLWNRELERLLQP